MDISNKTYETLPASARPGLRSSSSEELPPPLPIKNPSRGGSKTKPGQGSVGKQGLVPLRCSQLPPLQASPCLFELHSVPLQMALSPCLSPWISPTAGPPRLPVFWANWTALPPGSHRAPTTP